MKKILIIGATSLIAEHCARLWAARGFSLFLIGRNRELLSSIAEDLRVRGARSVFTSDADFCSTDQQSELIQKAAMSLDGIDIALIAHGSLPDQQLCQQSEAAAMSALQTNALSTVSFLIPLANLLEKQGSGTIVCISSVAGDRGRASNYVYGSSKALLNVFLSGLRQRLSSANVAVLTVKPGFVDTPMTASFRKNFLWSSAASVAKKIIWGIDKNKNEIYVPGFWRVIMLMIKITPEFIFKKLRL